MARARNTICLWYDKDAEEAARFYAETFRDSTVGHVYHAPADNPSGKAGAAEPKSNDRHALQNPMPRPKRIVPCFPLRP